MDENNTQVALPPEGKKVPESVGSETPSWMPNISEEPPKRPNSFARMIRTILIVVIFLIIGFGLMSRENKTTDGQASNYKKINSYIENFQNKELKKKLEKGTLNLNDEEDYDFMPIYVAAEVGNVEAIDILVKHGADIDVEDGGLNISSPLEWAIINEQYDVANRLIDLGADLNKKDTNGITPIFSASKNGNLEFLTNLVKSGADANVKDFSGKTPLHIAAENLQIPVYEFLLEKGLDEKAVTNAGLTVSNYALMSGDLDFMEELIAKGITLETDLSGMELIHLAKTSDAVDYVMENFPETDINAKNANGETTLLLNVLSGGDFLKTLLDYGADINIPQNEDMTPLMMACWMNFSNDTVDTVEFLIAAGADTSAEDSFGSTAKDYAVFSGMPDSVIAKL